MTERPMDNTTKAKKRVIIFRESLLPISETFIKEQALALTEWEPILLGYQRVKNGLDLTGLNYQLIPGLQKRWIGRKWLRLLQWLDLPHKPTVSTLKALDAPLVHVHFGTDATDIWPSVKAAGLPMLVTLHGYDINIYKSWWEAGSGGFRRKKYPNRLLEMAKHPNVNFLAVSNAIKQRAIEYGIPESKITVSYIGVNTERFKPGGLPLAQRANRILFVGRMVEKKAPLLMVQAFAEVRKVIPNAELVMIGDGPLLEDAKAKANQLSAPVTFLGQCNRAEVLEQMHQVKMLCLPSIKAKRGDAEGFGLVLIEAQACGVPVTTSALGGATEAIKYGKTGFSFMSGNIENFTARMIDIISSDEISLLSKNCISHIQYNFNIFTLIKKLESIYLRSIKVNK